MSHYPFLLYIPDWFQKDFSEFKRVTKKEKTNRVIIRLIKAFMEGQVRLDINVLRIILQQNPTEIERFRKLLDEFKGDLPQTGDYLNFG